MQNNYELQYIFFSFQPCVDLHYFFASTTGGGLLRRPMNPPLNGVAEVV